jgi:hypothetical protein
MAGHGTHRNPAKIGAGNILRLAESFQKCFKFSEGGLLPQPRSRQKHAWLFNNIIFNICSLK